jgi:tRNA(fMet)-specific endonuclease VapC
VIWILDTDHLSLLLQNHLQVIQQVERRLPEEIAITVVTAEEQLRGRFSVIRQASQARQAEQLVQAYRKLRDTLNDLKQFYILDFTPAAFTHYETLLKRKLRVGTQDLRIAAIALSLNATIVTRNQRDFERIPGLLLEDWTV